MSYEVMNFDDNDDVELSPQYGPFRIVEYIRDLSCTRRKLSLSTICQ